VKSRLITVPLTTILKYSVIVSYAFSVACAKSQCGLYAYY